MCALINPQQGFPRENFNAGTRVSVCIPGTCQVLVYFVYLWQVIIKTMKNPEKPSSLQLNLWSAKEDSVWEDSKTKGQDHVLLLIEPLPHTTPSRLVNSLKGVSSRFAYASPDGVLRQEFPELEKYYWKGGLWSPSYFIASCGGAPLDVVKQYIKNQ